ncbi:hypothetical protein [Photobacterium phosphoreum]|uniref:hypothetical protein n=1 Tax=Photobacterium phosphoreum TaxID=659 RepID=UPI000D17DD05|nr:hypothetical protein [Photobacterium phosphoreum]PTB31095.1 hypothetical protein DAT36_18760 [Photobacterium phosphoreum]
MNIDIKQKITKDKKSPHKALMLLLAFQAYRNGSERLLSFETFYYPKMIELLNICGIKVPHPEYPFWRLLNDDIWNVELNKSVKENNSGDVSKLQLIQANAYGGLKVSIYNEIIMLSENGYVIFYNNFIEDHIDISVESKTILLSKLGLNY